MENSAVQGVMEAEYALLCVGDALKYEFDEHARQSGIYTTMPSQYMFVLYLFAAHNL